MNWLNARTISKIIFPISTLENIACFACSFQIFIESAPSHSYPRRLSTWKQVWSWNRIANIKIKRQEFSRRKEYPRKFHVLKFPPWLTIPIATLHYAIGREPWKENYYTLSPDRFDHRSDLSLLSYRNGEIGNYDKHVTFSVCVRARVLRCV